MNIQNTVEPPRVCFSYCRFSSAQQKGNSSTARQSEIALTIANQRGWIIRKEWEVKQEAVSAYKKHNFPKLKAIIELANNGTIPPGTIMIIETIDRLTRACVDEGREMMRQILLSGIEICDTEGNHFTKADLDNPQKLMQMISDIASANQYSAKLSRRVKAAYQVRYQKILNGEPIKKMNNLPGWLDNATRQPNDKAQTVQTVYQMYLNGMGSSVIARELNQKNIATFSGNGSWTQGVVYDLLSNRQVLGEYKVNGETVKDFLPAIISEELFLKVQAKLNDNRNKRPTGNTVGHITNLFSGVAYCTCGEHIKVTAGKRLQYITCYGYVNKGAMGCSAPMVQYKPLELAFTQLLKVNPVQLTRDENGNTPNVQVQLLRGQLIENEKQTANITKALGIAVTKSLVLRQAQLEAEAEDIKREIQLEAAKTVSARGGADKLNQIVARLDTLDVDSDFRVVVQGWIRENVNRIDIDRTEKTFTVDLKNGNLVKMGLDGSVIECKSFVSLFTGQPIQAVRQAVNV